MEQLIQAISDAPPEMIAKLLVSVYHQAIMALVLAIWFGSMALGLWSYLKDANENTRRFIMGIVVCVLISATIFFGYRSWVEAPQELVQLLESFGR